MSGAATGAVRVVLRLEGLCVLAAACLAYGQLGAGWGVFALCFLAPDIAFLGYLAGPRAGAAAYNCTHSYIGALLCLVAGGALSAPAVLSVALIWFAHIGFDRALGYGLKYSAGFGFTHLGRTGRAKAGDT